MLHTRPYPFLEPPRQRPGFLLFFALAKFGPPANFGQNMNLRVSRLAHRVEIFHPFNRYAVIYRQSEVVDPGVINCATASTPCGIHARLQFHPEIGIVNATRRPGSSPEIGAASPSLVMKDTARYVV